MIPPTRVWGVRQPTIPIRGLIDATVNTGTLEPTQLGRKTSTEVASMGKVTPKVSNLNAHRLTKDDVTGAVYLDVITASIGRMVIGHTEPEGPTIEEVMDQ